MVDNSVRSRIAEATKGMWGSLNLAGVSSIYDTLGHITLAGGKGGSNYYDVTGFFASPKVYSGAKHKYVYGQFKAAMKPRWFERYNGGVKLEEAQFALDDEVLKGSVDLLIEKEQRAVNARQRKDAIGYSQNSGAGTSLLSIFGKQPIVGSSIIEPADCNATPGTAAPNGAVNWTGAGKTEQNINAILGTAIRTIGGKVMDSDTEETILKESGNTYEFQCHPRFAHILETNKDLLDSGETDEMTYAERMLKSWNTTIKPTMHIDSYTGDSNATATAIISANTKENFFLVDVESPTWMPWKEIDNGETIELVKRYKLGAGYIAKEFNDADEQPYKAMYVDVSTPFGS